MRIRNGLVAVALGASLALSGCGGNDNPRATNMIEAVALNIQNASHDKRFSELTDASYEGGTFAVYSFHMRTPVDVALTYVFVDVGKDGPHSGSGDYLEVLATDPCDSTMNTNLCDVGLDGISTEYELMSTPISFDEANIRYHRILEHLEDRLCPL